jgi:hypothetical protein
VLSRLLRACRSDSAASTSFLLAAAATVWGLTLQLLLGACLLWELHTVNILPAVTAFLFIVLLLALSGSVVAYAGLTAADTLKKEMPTAENAERMQAQVPVPPTDWALL